MLTLPQASSRAAAARAATGVLTTVVSSATRSIEFMPVAASRGSFYQAESAQLEVLVDRALATRALGLRVASPLKVKHTVSAPASSERSFRGFSSHARVV